MSPTEFELRAALRFGEDDDGGPDAEAIMRRADDHRRQRRARIGGGLAAAAVVAGVAVAGGVVLGSGGHDSSSGDSSAAGGVGAPAAGASAAAPKGGRSADSTNAYAGVAGACPAAAPRLVLPGGGGSGQFGAPAELLSQDVTSVLVCGYGPTEDPQPPTTATVTGAAARSLAASLDAAPSVHQGICPQFRTGGTAQYVLLGISADGARGAPVVLTFGANPCQTRATNGTGVRYGWVPPAAVASLFASPLTVTGSAAPSPQHS